MLVDINWSQDLIDESNKRMKEAYANDEFLNDLIIDGVDSFCERIQCGLYYTSLNFDHDIRLFSNNKVVKQWGNFYDKYNYGVCDSHGQVLDKYPELNRSDKKFVVSFCEIRKDEEPEQEGWRWEKWGDYIGTQNPQVDYLYDEPEIERVFVYHIYEIE